jgi:hypothetical protein
MQWSCSQVLFVAITHSRLLILLKQFICLQLLDVKISPLFSIIIFMRGRGDDNMRRVSIGVVGGSKFGGEEDPPVDLGRLVQRDVLVFR